MNLRKNLRRSLKRNIWLLMAIEFFAETRFYFPVAVLAFESITGSYTMAMSVFSVMAITMTLSEVPTGVMSDKWGRRGTLLLGSLAEVCAVGGYALAFAFTDYALLFLYTGATCYGISSAMFSGNNHAMVYETLAYYKRTKELPKVLGRISAAGQIGLALMGAVTGGLLWLGMDYAALVMMSVPPLLVSFLLAWLTIEPPEHIIEDRTPWQHMKKAAKLILNNGKLRLLALAAALQQGAGQSNYYFAPGFIASVWPEWLTPVYRTGQHLIGTMGFWHAGKVIKRFGALKVLVGVTVMANVLQIVALAIANILSPVLMMFTQFSYAFGTTAERTVQQENFTDAQRATMGSLISFCAGIFMALSSLLMGWFSDLWGPAIAMLGTYAGRAVIVNWIYMQLYTKHK